MTTADKILCITAVLGLLISLCSVIVTNLAVQQMRGVLNNDRAPQDQLGWTDAIQKVAQNVIDTYRAAYPDGPLYRKLVVGYYMLGIGLVIMLGSAFMFKFVD